MTSDGFYSYFWKLYQFLFLGNFLFFQFLSFNIYSQMHWKHFCRFQCFTLTSVMILKYAIQSGKSFKTWERGKNYKKKKHQVCLHSTIHRHTHNHSLEKWVTWRKIFLSYYWEIFLTYYVLVTFSPMYPK